MPAGFVYILTSPNSPFVKIGGTEFPPAKRLREINSTDPYARHGPWLISDFRQVKDWQAVEAALHAAFATRRHITIVGARELFDVPVVAARADLERLEPAQLVHHDAVDKMCQDRAFALYLEKLFRFSGLASWLHTQGSWTVSLFPRTGAGRRYFTLNIGSHEVAYSTRWGEDGHGLTHSIVVDRLIHDYPELAAWLSDRRGSLQSAPYATARDRATSVTFDGTFPDAELLFAKPGMRRALIAYWSDALIDLHERDVQSVHAQHHNYNAVAALMQRLRDRPLF